MHEHLSPDRIENFWRRLFPGEIPDRLLVAEPLEDEELELEGQKLVAVNSTSAFSGGTIGSWAPQILRTGVRIPGSAARKLGRSIG
jgi:hypothetical protein